MLTKIVGSISAIENWQNVMELHELLAKKRLAILKEWLTQIYATYPSDTSGFLAGEKDKFANPIGCAIATNAECILAGLIEGIDTAALSGYMEPMIRIRAVQDFTPSQAVSFMGSLKTVIAKQLETQIHKCAPGSEWEALMARIDHLNMRAYELHTEIKEEIQRIRIKEIEKKVNFLNRLTESRTK